MALKHFAAILSLALLPATIHGALLIQNGQKVAFMGDSITAFGWDQPGGYVKLTISGLQTLGVTAIPIPAGESGDDSRQMLARLHDAVLAKKPDWMTLSCGVNDVWHGAGGVDLEGYKKNITAIVDQAQAAGIKVLIMTATVIGEDLPNANNMKLTAYNDFLRQLAQQRNLPLADENAAFQNAIKNPPATHLHGNLLTGDGVHPIADGNLLMAKTLLGGMGATDAQLAQVDAGWMEAPASANVSCDMGYHVDGPITLGQYRRLQAAASKQNYSVPELCNKLLFQTILDVGKAHGSDNSSPQYGDIMAEIQRDYLAKVVSAAAAP